MTAISDGRLKELIERVKASHGSNALDMEIEIALFEPDGLHTSVRPNAAGTKLVYTRQDGGTDTHWAGDYTLNADNRQDAIRRLSSLTQEQK